MEDWLIQWGFPFFVAFLGALVHGVLGFGSGLVCMALLPLLWDISYTVGVLSPLASVLSILLTFKLKEHIRLDEARPLLLATPFGVITGLWMLQSWPDSLMKALLGALLLFFVGNSLLQSSTHRTVHPSFGAIAGFLGGATGAAFGVSGPPVLIYATAAGWERDRFRANLQIFFSLTCILAFFGLLKTGIVNPTTLPHSLILGPAALIGVLTGNRIAQNVPSDLFHRLVLGALAIMGLAYVGQWISA